MCPDFVVEIRSGSDNIAPLRAKMQFYLANAARLGWLIDPQNRRVYIYREGQEEPEVLEDPETISGEGVLPGFTFEIRSLDFQCNLTGRATGSKRQSPDDTGTF